MGSNKLIVGVNDLQSQFPEIAAEAYEWDPSTFTGGSHQKKDWKCSKGHVYFSTIKNRTKGGTACAVCSGHQVLAGFNDLQTKFPKLAKEAYGWDPTTVIAGSGKKKIWKCSFGHTWDVSPNSRINNKSGCPVCSNKKLLVGYNDLQSSYPELAKEAYEWDTTTVIAGSDTKKTWRCNLGHTWEASPNNRTSRSSGCPICSGRQVLPGYNDLKTKFPDIAAEAYGWDPSIFAAGTAQKKDWKCDRGHLYRSNILDRTYGANGCPFCSGQQLLKGFNDLKTKFPDIAAEAYGWDPSTVVAGTDQKKDWKCNRGHLYHSTVSGRTKSGCGCAICAEYGFNPGKDAWFYLMQRPGEQQLGISNVLEDRLRKHERNGWVLLEHTSVPSIGQKVLDTEKALKKWLKKEIGLMEGTTENWSTTKMEVQSLAELKARSGIETDLF